jgi:hypothetical protein
LRAETGGGFQAQNAGERPEFCSLTALRPANRPNETAELAINTIRTLSMDAVQAANSGHPGAPMALAPLVYTPWNRAMRFDPQDPI